MAEADLPTVLAMERDLFDEPVSLVTMQRELANPLALYLVACPGDTPPATPAPVLGYIGVWFIVDEAHVISLAVQPEARRRGIASALLLSALLLASARHAAMMTLEVRASNTAAQLLYAGFGFRKLGVRRGYYTDNHEDAWILTRDGLDAPDFREQIARRVEQ